MARSAGDAAAGVSSGAAHVEALHRPPIGGVAKHGAGGPKLVQGHVAVHDVAADEAELALQVERREDHAAEHRCLEAGGIGLDRVDDRVGRRLAVGVPVELGGELLRSEEHTSELQSLMRISYAVFFLKKKKAQKANASRTYNI